MMPRPHQARLLLGLALCLCTLCCYKPIDPLTCGNDNECQLRYRCVQFRCTAQVPCGVHHSECVSAGATRTLLCVDLQTNARHCGACNKACPSGQGCSSGICVASQVCQGTRQSCGGSCVDLQSDPRHCGRCFAACPAQTPCTQGRCQGASGCRLDSDCKAGARCQTSTGRCVGCLSNGDCQRDSICDPTTYTCKSTSSPKRGLGQSCAGSASQSNCHDGLHCLRIGDTESVCFQPCAADADCTRVAGQTCLTLGDQIKLCMGAASKGEPCGYRIPRQALCRASADPLLYCDDRSQTCKEAIKQKTAGAPCTTSTDRSQPIRYCDASAQLVCDQSRGVCKQVKTVGEGKACDPTGQNGEEILCDSGLSCIRFDQAGQLNRCHQICDPTKSGECSFRGTLCLGVLANNQGLCMDNTCSKDSDCAFPGYACNDSPSTGGKLCFPKLPSGKGEAGQLCSEQQGERCNTDPAKGGDAQLFCLRVQGKQKGYCSKTCDKGEVCPKARDSMGQKTIESICSQVNANSKACLYPCGQPGQRCPPGLTCQNVGAQLCLAP